MLILIMPNTFTSQEYCDIHFVYGFCNGSSDAARRRYAEMYPARRLPSACVFTSTHRRLAEGI